MSKLNNFLHQNKRVLTCYTEQALVSSTKKGKTLVSKGPLSSQHEFCWNWSDNIKLIMMLERKNDEVTDVVQNVYRENALAPSQQFTDGEPLLRRNAINTSCSALEPALCQCSWEMSRTRPEYLVFCNLHGRWEWNSTHLLLPGIAVTMVIWEVNQQLKSFCLSVTCFSNH